jgi:hypothetical protein
MSSLTAHSLATSKRMKPRPMDEEIYNMISQAEALGPRLLP